MVHTADEDPYSNYNTGRYTEWSWRYIFSSDK